MIPGHVVVYDERLWIFVRDNDTPAAYAGGPSHTNYHLAPLDNPTERRYVQDPAPRSIWLLPGCSGCEACPGWRCHPGCKVGNEARKKRVVR